MNESHACLVPILGKMSGRDTDKRRLCKEAGHAWVIHRMAAATGDALEMELLQGCWAYLQLRPISWQVGRSI